jgi:hypothetical protein
MIDANSSNHALRSARHAQDLGIAAARGFSHIGCAAR